LRWTRRVCPTPWERSPCEQVSARAVECNICLGRAIQGGAGCSLLHGQQIKFGHIIDIGRTGVIEAIAHIGRKAMNSRRFLMHRRQHFAVAAIDVRSRTNHVDADSWLQNTEHPLQRRRVASKPGSASRG
jgi:hypothetical protein